MATVANSTIQVRSMTEADVPGAYALSREQNWAHRETDWAAMLALGQGVVAEVAGEVVGTTMWWTFGSAVASIGLVIVSDRLQGKGIGRKLMTAALDHLGDRSVLLNATDEGLRLYASLGFMPTGRVSQHQGAAFSLPIADLQPDERVAPMKAGHLPPLAVLDRAASGYDRSELLVHLCETSPGVVLDAAEGPTAFAMFRRFGRGHSIGPVVATDLARAKLLITHWLASNTGMFCRVDVTENGDLSEWLEGLGLPCVGRVTQMCRGTPPASGADARIYGLVNQALG